MATSKQKAAAAAKTARHSDKTVADPRGIDETTPSGTDEELRATKRPAVEDDDALTPRAPRKSKDDPLVSVKVPQAFKLTLASSEVVAYEPGIQDMPKSHAEHYYAKANGVELAEEE